MTPIDPFLEAAVRAATPLALAALGETVVERSGVINIGLEGVVLAGAFGALVGAGVADNAGGGYVLGAGAGLLTAAVFALFTVSLRADQIITGAAINLLALGVTGSLYRALYGVGGAALGTPTSPPIAIPLLSQLPVVGHALFVQPAVTYLLYVAAPVTWWWMFRTQAGLAIRALGESPAAARAAGIVPSRLQWLALLFGGTMGGLAGATLVLAQAGTFAEGMSAGRGFIAVAIVALGRWHPLGMLVAAALFGAATAMQYVFQVMGLDLPYQLFLALPYILTLVALAVGARRLGRGAAPAALGRQDG